MQEKKQEWIETGYAFVAKNGFANLSVNFIAREVGKSKSSFYHYFGNLEQFITSLLEHHLYRTKLFTTELNKYENGSPEMIHAFLNYKVDTFFHKQIRINRDQPLYKEYVEKAFELYETAIAEKWANHVGLEHRRIFAQKFNRFVSEHFSLTITPETFTYEWLENYSKEIIEMVRQMKVEE